MGADNGLARVKLCPRAAGIQGYSVALLATSSMFEVAAQQWWSMGCNCQQTTRMRLPADNINVVANRQHQWDAVASRQHQCGCQQTTSMGCNCQQTTSMRLPADNINAIASRQHQCDCQKITIKPGRLTCGNAAPVGCKTMPAVDVLQAPQLT